MKDNPFITSFSQWLATVDENYLIALSNKGIYKRSLKDLEKGLAVTATLEEGAVDLRLGGEADGVQCRVSEDIKNSTCTCPSRTMCKHRVIGLLYLKEHFLSLFGASQPGAAEVTGETADTAETIGTAPPAAADFSALLELSPGELKEMVTPGEFNGILFRLQYGVEVDIEEKAVLTVTFRGEGIFCRFPPREPLKHSICSCKSESPCFHRVEALFRFLLARGKTSLQEILTRDVPAVPAEVLEQVKGLVEKILNTGLSRLPAGIGEEIEGLAVIAGARGGPGLENQLRGLKGDMDQYIGKHAGFSPGETIARLVRVFNQVLLLQGEPGPHHRHFTGESRSAYIEVPPLELTGMGAEAWYTKSGYAGMTIYFYSREKEKWFTYSYSRPVYFDDARVNVRGIFKSEAPWGTGLPLREFSRSLLRLDRARVNKEYRLSSSEECRARVTGKTETDWLEHAPSSLLVKDWTTLGERYVQEHSCWFLRPGRTPHPVILDIDHWGKLHYDDVRQVLKGVLYDAGKNKLSLEVSFSPYSKRMIRNIEQAQRAGVLPGLILAKVFLRPGGLAVFPIAAYGEKGNVFNWMLE